MWTDSGEKKIITEQNGHLLHYEQLYGLGAFINYSLLIFTQGHQIYPAQNQWIQKEIRNITAVQKAVQSNPYTPSPGSEPGATLPLNVPPLEAFDNVNS